MTLESEPAPVPPAPRKTRRLLLIGVLVVLALSGWAMALIGMTRASPPRAPEQTGAVVVFHIQRTPPALLAGNAPADVGEFESYRQSQAVLVRRRLLLVNVLKAPGVSDLAVVRAQSDPVAWLADNLRVSFAPSAEFMRVELDGEQESELVTVLGAMTKVYLAEVDEYDHGIRRRRIAKLEEVQRGYRAERERYHKRLDTIAQALGSRDATTLAAVAALAAEELRTAVRELATVRQQRAVLVANDPQAGAGPEAKKLEAREQVAKEQVRSLQNEIGKSNEYRLELENIQQQVLQTERASQRLADEIEAAKIEIQAQPRVTVAEEAAPRRREG